MRQHTLYTNKDTDRPTRAATKLCPECGGLGHFPFGNGCSAGKCAGCNGTGRVPADPAPDGAYAECHGFGEAA